ncbi:MAG: hypothetical protein H6707_12405 [Deltaproteobacteria bacterium]|nr:hypothetical protein [Deltaproteobacteria bacterium]
MQRQVSIIVALMLFACGSDDKGKSNPPIRQADGGATGGTDSSIRRDSASVAPQCDDRWLLGSTFYKCPDCGLGQKCDPSAAPRNCADGSFLKFNDGDCRCIAACSSFATPKKDGDQCDKAGKWHCRTIANGRGSRGLMCVPDAWNLCVEGGGTIDPPNPAQDAGPPCKSAGQSCTFDDECCSSSCDTISGACE